MAINTDPLFGIHSQALSLWSRRNEVLASNIANADTPNFKAKDVDFATALSTAGSATSMRLATTHGAHLQPASGADFSTDTLYRIPHQPSLDGNSVEVDVEQAEFAQNALRYQASLRFIAGRIGSMRSAITGGDR